MFWRVKIRIKYLRFDVKWNGIIGWVNIYCIIKMLLDMFVIVLWIVKIIWGVSLVFIVLS